MSIRFGIKTLTAANGFRNYQKHKLAWLEEMEDLRLQGENIDRPSTKWVFQKHLFVDLKVILERQPLRIGLGRLPAWLRNKHEIMSLDT